MLLQEQSEEIEKKQKKEKKIFLIFTTMILLHFFSLGYTWNTRGTNLIGSLECDRNSASRPPPCLSGVLGDEQEVLHPGFKV